MHAHPIPSTSCTPISEEVQLFPCQPWGLLQLLPVIKSSQLRRLYWQIIFIGRQVVLVSFLRAKEVFAHKQILFSLKLSSAILCQ